MAYERPQVTVDQNLTMQPTSLDREQPAFIFGPNYELHRYSNAEEKPKTFLGTWAPGDTTLSSGVPFPNAMDDSKVDTTHDYTKLFGDSVVVELFPMGPAEPVSTVDSEAIGGYSALLFPDAFVDVDDGGNPVERAEGLPRNIRAGDAIMVSYTLDGESYSVVAKATSVSYHSVEVGDSGVSGTTVEFQDIVPTGSTNIAASLVATASGVEFPKENPMASGTQDAWQWRDMADANSGSKSVAVYVLYAKVDGFYENAQYLPVLSADLYVTYRELVTSYSDGFHSLVGDAAAATLGEIDPANPLAMGVYMAALNSTTDDGDQAPPVYFMAVPSDDIAGYEKVLSVATLNSKAYVFAPTTRDPDVLERVKSHVTDMSVKTVKMWRIGVVSAEVPSEKQILGSTLNMGGKDYYSLVTDLPSGGGVLVKVTKGNGSEEGNPDTRFVGTVVAGDTVRLYSGATDYWGNDEYTEYEVVSVVNNNMLKVKAKPSEISLRPADVVVRAAAEEETRNDRKWYKTEVFHVYTSRELATEVASVSSEMYSRRMYNVFPPVFKRGGVSMTGEFAACAVAGLISAVEPQQPITNVTVRGIDNIALTYSTYSKFELDEMAAGGTFIVAQDLPNDRVYVRHQISTKYSEGNINTGELSVTKDVDSISYAFSDAFAPYVGKYNIFPDFLAKLENLVYGVISELGRSTSEYGPKLIAEETSLEYIRQNELYKDHVDVAISLSVPYPCNNIDIVLTV